MPRFRSLRLARPFNPAYRCTARRKSVRVLDKETEVTTVSDDLTVSADAWRILAATVRGTSHQRSGTEGQDSHCWRLVAGRCLVAAVADGAGSAPHGGPGAEIAARTAVEFLAAQSEVTEDGCVRDGRERVAAALSAAREAVATEAVVRGVPERDLATTLIVVLASPEGVAVGQVGDGAAIVRERGGPLLALTSPGNEACVNETTFLVTADALSTAQLVTWEGAVESLALFTDGLQRLALRMPEAVPHAPFFQPLFRFLADAADLTLAQRELEAFFNSPRITERTDDDLTLFLAAPVHS